MKTILKLFLLICGLLLAGCNPFAPELTDDLSGKALILTEQKTPQDVLTNFRYAYNFKDSLVYSDLLDSSFLFISKNFATDPVTDLIWGRDVDIKTTVGIFRHFQTINLTWQGTVFNRPLNEDSTVVEIKNTFQLTLNGGSDIPPLNGEALFIFQRKIIGTLPDTSHLWKIIRWEDLSSF